jgi:hypothetical protein
MSEDRDKATEAEGLLREWFYANADFDMDAWNKRTRDFFEDRDQGPETIEEKYRCCRCGAIYVHAPDAIDCCGPIISKVFECPICRCTHSDESSASVCCNDGEAALAADGHTSRR